MTRLVPLFALLAGCLYLEPINERPSLQIVPRSGDPVFRGDHRVWDAIVTDRQHRAVRYDWKVYRCSDATTQDGCDVDPFFTGTSASAEFDVPIYRDDQLTPVEGLRLLVAATDSAGTSSKGYQLLVVPVGDHPPALTPRADSRHGFVVGAPVAIYVKYGDTDDKPETIHLDWQTFTPTPNAVYTLVDLAVIQDPLHPESLQAGKTFTPMATGPWSIQILASDPLGSTNMATVPIGVVADHPPCLAQLTPIIPPPGQTLPISDPTLFKVDVVTDDLDPYPPNPADPITGTTTFAWSIRQPGATTHVPLQGATANRVSIDPSVYAPGDVVDLRVEIFDRNHTPINCADGMATCSVISDMACLQRESWKVEIR